MEPRNTRTVPLDAAGCGPCLIRTLADASLDRKEEDDAPDTLAQFIKLSELMKDRSKLRADDAIDLHEETQDARAWWRPGNLHLNYVSAWSQLRETDQLGTALADLAEHS